MATDEVTKATRRRRGEPRRLLLDAARDLFARQGFTNTTAREIADLAGVSEPLLFRHFGSKVGLFREALVVPFLELVEEFEGTWQLGALATLDGEEASRRFLGDLFDRFQANRGIVLTLWGTEAETVPELVESGVCDEITEGLRRLVDVSTGDARTRDGAHGVRSRAERPGCGRDGRGRGALRAVGVPRTARTVA